MLPILQIGPLAIQTPGLVLLLSIWVGLTFAERYARSYGMSANGIYNLSLAALIAGVAGARFIYAARFPEAFSASPTSLVSLNPGLLDPVGGVAAGLLAALIYGQHARLPFWNTLDSLTPVLAIVSIGFGFSQLAAGTAFGAPTDLPWGIELWGAKRHPTQIYSILASVLILAAVWPGWHGRVGLFATPGRTFLTFIALSAGARLFFEAFRGDSAILSNGLRTVQIIAWLVLAASLWALTLVGPGIAGRADERSKNRGKTQYSKE